MVVIFLYFNNTGHLNTEYFALPDLSRETVCKYKNNTAIMCNNDSVTYQKWDEESNKVTEYLLSIDIST
ncbi:hypothetical protein B0A67_21130 [Flavobacterium aquidurense]|nr:hypothetical protein B0A67_21130 [Flavobacterium aquidurense]